MPLYAFGGAQPLIDPSAFVHPDAVLVGHVTIGAGCYVASGACIRGDFCSIRVGAGSNVQDCCVIHGYPGTEVILDDECHLGHCCVIHGARLERDILVGMNAVILDNAVLGAQCVIGSGCVVPSGFVVPPRKLAVGVPARIVADVSEERVRAKGLGTRWYQQLAQASLRDMRPVRLQDCLGQIPGPSEMPPLSERLAWVRELEAYTEPSS
ncbi:MAG: hypothetical protein GXX83_10855 [Gaiellales bacterium]|nr:hypothetical protein [Gaiellales bacterium]